MSATPSTLLYAMGGGLGHLSRVWWTLEAAKGKLLPDLSPPSGRLYLLSASSFAPVMATRIGATHIVPPANLNGDAAGFRAFLQKTLETRRVQQVWLDAFPQGILGELDDQLAPHANWYHFARRLRYDVYGRRLRGVAPPRFAHTYMFEFLEATHLRQLEQQSSSLSAIKITPPRAPAWGPGPHVPFQGPFTLIVHAGSMMEQTLLRAEARHHIECGNAPPHVVELLPYPDGHIVYPAFSYWEKAEFVVSAAGFHAILQGAYFRKRQAVVPLPRALDDQHWRAKSQLFRKDFWISERAVSAPARHETSASESSRRDSSQVSRSDGLVN